MTRARWHMRSRDGRYMVEAERGDRDRLVEFRHADDRFRRQRIIEVIQCRPAEVPPLTVVEVRYR